MRVLSTSRWTVRARLTLLYGGFFLAAGAVLLLVTYLLMQRALGDQPPPEVAAYLVQPPETTELTGMTPVSGMPVDPAAIQLPQEARDSLDARRRADEAVWYDLKRSALRSLISREALSLGLVSVLAVSAAWLVAGRTLRPVQQITATARRVADRNLHERISLTGPRDELRELADTFDEMLERLDRAFEGQRRFVANASHELKTPLAINRTVLEVAAGRPDAPPELRELAVTLLQVNHRHERLIDGLLRLARAEQAVLDPVPVDLTDVVCRVVRARNGHAVGVGVRIDVDTEPAAVNGDPVLLERLVQNLVQNALQYNVPDGWVRVACRPAAGKVVLTVTNAGAVMMPRDVPALFEPFRRLTDRVRSADGTGLGLSIVRSVTHAHGGEVSAEPLDAGGLLVRVCLPAATAGRAQPFEQ